MSRFITVSLDKRGVSCVARMLDDEAPRTCAAVWDALPLAAAVFHGKYARNEIYTLLPAFAPSRSRARRTPRSRRFRVTCAGSRSTPTISAIRRTGTKTLPAPDDRGDRRPCPVLRAEQPADQRRSGLGAGQRLRRRRRGARRDGRGLSGPLDGRRPRRDPELQPPGLNFRRRLPPMAFSVAGKRVLITGASSGVGAALARALAPRRSGRGADRAQAGPTRRGVGRLPANLTRLDDVGGRPRRHGRGRPAGRRGVGRARRDRCPGQQRGNTQTPGRHRLWSRPRWKPSCGSTSTPRCG